VCAATLRRLWTPRSEAGTGAACRLPRGGSTAELVRCDQWKVTMSGASSSAECAPDVVPAHRQREDLFLWRPHSRSSLSSESLPLDFLQRNNRAPRAATRVCAHHNSRQVVCRRFSQAHCGVSLVTSEGSDSRVRPREEPAESRPSCMARVKGSGSQAVIWRSY